VAYHFPPISLASNVTYPTLPRSFCRTWKSKNEKTRNGPEVEIQEVTVVQWCEPFHHHETFMNLLGPPTPNAPRATFFPVFSPCLLVRRSWTLAGPAVNAAGRFGLSRRRFGCWAGAGAIGLASGPHCSYNSDAGQSIRPIPVAYPPEQPVSLVTVLRLSLLLPVALGGRWLSRQKWGLDPRRPSPPDPPVPKTP